MCGIAGILSLNGKPIANADERIWRMTRQLEHRGPDYQGVYLSPDGMLALGNTRLAIVDPHNPTPQPMTTTDGAAVLSFNGEIYNYLDLRRDLEGRGVAFRTRMDTEVLLEGLRLDGEAFLERLDGMWAFADYDVNRRRLLLGRDLMGERHVFYRVADGELTFASEPTPLVRDAAGPLRLDFGAIVTALRFHAPPPGRSLVEGIHRLLPGHVMTVEVGQAPKLRRSHRLRPEKWLDFFERSPSLDQTIEVFEELLSRACLRRLPQEVPFISTLSGGLDSSLICLFASEFGRRKLRTLYGQSGDRPPQNRPDELDEYTASRLTSARLNTSHVRVHLDNDACVPVLHRLADNAFDGLIDPGTAAFQMLAEEARHQGIKVMLISDGPDELLGGYPIDWRSYAIDRLRAGRPLRYGLQRLLSGRRFRRRVLRRLGFGGLIVAPNPSFEPFRFTVQHEGLSSDLLVRILPSEKVAQTDEAFGIMDSVYAEVARSLDFSQQAALSYAALSLPDMFNLRTDRGFLNASIECRLPFQAPEMVEFMIAIPAAFRFGPDGTSKYLMRQIVERRIGPEIARRSKHGFSIPLWRKPEVYRRMGFEDTIASSPIFQDFPFRPGARALALDERFRKLQWPFFVLARLHKQLCGGRTERLDRSCPVTDRQRAGAF